MTTPEDFRADTKKTLEQLDEKLPAGSNVVMTGLADGRVLWDILHDRLHPIGEPNKDVTYENVYEWLLCLQLSPCNGWVSSQSLIFSIKN